MLTTVFALFLLAASIVGFMIWTMSRWLNAEVGKAKSDVAANSLYKAIDEAEDANKTRDEISRDYATGKPRRMQGKYDID